MSEILNHGAETTLRTTPKQKRNGTKAKLRLTMWWKESKLHSFVKKHSSRKQEKEESRTLNLSILTELPTSDNKPKSISVSKVIRYIREKLKWKSKPEMKVETRPASPHSMEALAAAPQESDARPIPAPTLETMLLSLTSDQVVTEKEVPAISSSDHSTTIQPIASSEQESQTLKASANVTTPPSITNIPTAGPSVADWLVLASQPEKLPLTNECEDCQGTQFLKDGRVCVLCCEAAIRPDSRLESFCKVDMEGRSIASRTGWDALSGGSSTYSSSDDEDYDATPLPRGKSGSFSLSRRGSEALSSLHGSAIDEDSKEKWLPKQISKSVTQWLQSRKRRTLDEPSQGNETLDDETSCNRSDTNSFIMRDELEDDDRTCRSNTPSLNSVMMDESGAPSDTVTPESLPKRTIRKLKSLPLISNISSSAVSSSSSTTGSDSTAGKFLPRRWGSLRKRPSTPSSTCVHDTNNKAEFMSAPLPHRQPRGSLDINPLASSSVLPIEVLLAALSHAPPPSLFGRSRSLGAAVGVCCGALSKKEVGKELVEMKRVGSECGVVVV
ncbi:hypothetical protein HDV05_006432 [Chytridiales sp. JEL 0842]|nr:hypothetical protein HDV05_006432 [Chytridiales sp. JEL 0842]